MLVGIWGALIAFLIAMVLILAYDVARLLCFYHFYKILHRAISGSIRTLRPIKMNTWTVQIWTSWDLKYILENQGFSMNYIFLCIFFWKWWFYMPCVILPYLSQDSPQLVYLFWTDLVSKICIQYREEKRSSKFSPSKSFPHLLLIFGVFVWW